MSTEQMTNSDWLSYAKFIVSGSVVGAVAGVALHMAGASLAQTIGIASLLVATPLVLSCLSRGKGTLLRSFFAGAVGAISCNAAAVVAPLMVNETLDLGSGTPPAAYYGAMISPTPKLGR